MLAEVLTQAEQALLADERASLSRLQTALARLGGSGPDQEALAHSILSLIHI